MSEEKKPEEQELDDAALERVSGGAVDGFIKLDGIVGESLDDKPRSTLYVPAALPKP